MKQKRIPLLALAALMLCTPLTGCKDDSSKQQKPEISLTDQQRQELQDEAQAIVDKIMGNGSSENDSEPDSTTTNTTSTSSETTTRTETSQAE